MSDETLKVEFEISTKNECTRSPWWIIVDPPKEPHWDSATSRFLTITKAITGPFFSREEANAELEGRRYAYGPEAVVYCHTGHRSGQYADKVVF